MTTRDKIDAIVRLVEEPVDDKTEMTMLMDQFGGNFDDAYFAGKQQGQALMAEQIRDILGQEREIDV